MSWYSRNFVSCVVLANTSLGGEFGRAVVIRSTGAVWVALVQKHPERVIARNSERIQCALDRLQRRAEKLTSDDGRCLDCMHNAPYIMVLGEDLPFYGCRKYQGELIGNPDLPTLCRFFVKKENQNAN